MADTAPAATRRSARRLRAVLIALLLLSVGCSGPRGGSPLRAVDREVNECAAVLPLARASVSGVSALAAIHAVSSRSALRIIVATGGTPPSRALRGRLCVVAYRGPYRREQVPLAHAGHGRFAVLIITARHPEVLVAELVQQLPPGV